MARPRFSEVGLNLTLSIKLNEKIRFGLELLYRIVEKTGGGDTVSFKYFHGISVKRVIQSDINSLNISVSSIFDRR